MVTLKDSRHKRKELIEPEPSSATAANPWKMHGPTPSRWLVAKTFKIRTPPISCEPAASQHAGGYSQVRSLTSGLLPVLLLAGLSARAADVKAIASAVDDHYNHLRSLQAEFTELYRGSGTERTESGTLWLKKPGKMRWEYRSPKEKLFVSDGKSAWFYVPEDGQARKSSAKKLEDLRSPLAFLLGKTKLEKELQGLSLASDLEPLRAGNTMLRGVPRGLEDQVSQIVLEVTPEHRIVRLIMLQADGASTEYRFADQKEDVAMGDVKFGFKPPPGTEVIEGGLED